MIRDITIDDYDTLHAIVHDSVCESVTTDKSEADYLIDDILNSLNRWFDSDACGYSSAFEKENRLVGFIIIKDYWNLSHLFVLPEFQRQGIGSALLSSALSTCHDLSPRNKIQLNSSSNAQSFYEASGFRKAGAGIDRPGGCVPYEYNFEHESD